MQELKDKLAKYGTVTECSGNNETFTVTIGSGFENDAINAFKCIDEINSTVQSTYPCLKSCIIETNKFHYVLSKSQQGIKK